MTVHIMVPGYVEFVFNSDSTVSGALITPFDD